MKLIVISPPTCVDGETRLVSSMLQAGLDRFHLRKPDKAKHYFERYLRDLQPDERKRIVLHSNHDLIDYWKLGVLISARLYDDLPLASSLVTEGVQLSRSRLYKLHADVAMYCRDHYANKIDE